MNETVCDHISHLPMQLQVRLPICLWSHIWVYCRTFVSTWSNNVLPGHYHTVEKANQTHDCMRSTSGIVLPNGM